MPMRIGIVDLRILSQDGLASLEKIEPPIKKEVLIPDVEKLVNGQWTRSSMKGFFERYNTLDEAVFFAKKLSAKHSSFVSLVDAGISTHGVKIPCLKVAKQDGNERKSIIILGGQHAREWISPASVFYTAFNLVTRYATKNKQVMEMLDSHDWYFIPIANPDGYRETFTTHRYKRKTVALIPNDKCKWSMDENGIIDDGTDMNRNWVFARRVIIGLYVACI